MLTMDGVGEWSTTSLALGRGKDLEDAQGDAFSPFLGLLYSAFTYYLGFKVNSGEYKVMGLAPTGSRSTRRRILDEHRRPKARRHVPPRPDYFDYCTGLPMTNDEFARLFGAAGARPATELLT